MIPDNTIICGAMPRATKVFPDGHFNCCISSPPYWALRDYGVDGQLGLEPTFEEYIEKLCDIYDEVKRVLRDDGTCFVNLGDTYNNVTPGGRDKNRWPKQSRNDHTPNRRSLPANVQVKSLCLIPQRFAIEMVNRGWILRNVIIWHKPNPMPSSAKDRFTVDFEYVYFFVKNNQNLWYFRPDGKISDKQPDYKNGTEGLDWYWGIRKKKKVKLSLWQGFKYWFEPQYEPYDYDGRHKTTLEPTRKYGTRNYSLNNPQQMARQPMERWPCPLGRNKRTVWTIPTQSFPKAHFATFPEKLVEPMIKAGCPEFVCTKCGKAREKIYELQGETTTEVTKQKGHSEKRGAGGIKVVQNLDYAGGHGNNIRPKTFKGYTDCGCNDYYCRNCKKSLILDEIRVKLGYDLEQSRKKLFELWVKILSSETAKILLKKMRGAGKSEKRYAQHIPLVENREKAAELQRGQSDHDRLLVDNGGWQENNATQILDGEKVRPETKTQRRSTSQKRDKRRQSTEQPRIEIKENTSRDSVLSILQKEFQDKIICPYCYSDQITIAHADWRPGRTLDCFLRFRDDLTGGRQAA